jgi:hypothetical protein
MSHLLRLSSVPFLNIQSPWFFLVMSYEILDCILFKHELNVTAGLRQNEQPLVVECVLLSRS